MLTHTPHAQASLLAHDIDAQQMGRLGAKMVALPIALLLVASLACVLAGLPVLPVYLAKEGTWINLAALLSLSVFALVTLPLRRLALSRIYLGGETLSYAGTPKNLFWITAPPAMLHLAVQIAPVALALAVGPTFKGFTTLVGAGLYVFKDALSQFYGLRYRLQQTAWRNVRCELSGTFDDYLRVYAYHGVMACLTLGYGYAGFAVQTRSVLLNHAYVGGHPVRYEGDTQEARGLYIRGACLSLISLGVYLPWHIAALTNYHQSKTSVAGVRCRSFQDGASLGWLWFGNSLATFATLGLAYGWIRARSLTYRLEHMALEGDAPAIDAKTTPLPPSVPQASGISDLLSGTFLFD